MGKLFEIILFYEGKLNEESVVYLGFDLLDSLLIMSLFSKPGGVEQYLRGRNNC